MLGVLHVVGLAVYSPQANGPGGKVGTDVQTLENWAIWGFFAVCVMGVLAAALKLAWQHHRGGGYMEGSGALAAVLIACAIGAGASGLVGSFAT
jgi:hypothetical protein